MSLQERSVKLPARMLPDAKPEAGDVLISRSRQSSAGFALSATPGSAQILCRTYDEAFRRAQGFAAHQRVDVWVAEAGHDLALVARYRTRVQAAGHELEGQDG
jgi:hypothetical protein